MTDENGSTTDADGSTGDADGSTTDADGSTTDTDDSTANADGATTVVAQGTFDILHPGHVHYLEEAAAMGDRLYVIVARRTNVDHKEAPVCSARQRRDVVAALEAVDEAVLGHEEDIFVPIEEIRPDVIALGHDQHHDPEVIERELADRGIDCEVRRVSAREPRHADELLSTRLIVERIVQRRG